MTEPKSLIERLQTACIASCSCMTKTHEILYHKENCLYRILRESVDEIEGWEKSFLLYNKASQRGIKAWQAAHPGNDNVWPDQAKMVEWLMERHAIMAGVLMRAGEQFRFYEKNHRAKADAAFGQSHASPDKFSDADQKANVNRDMAKLCDDALKDA